MRAAAITIFGTQARSITVALADWRVPDGTSLGAAVANYVAVLSGVMAFPLHKIMTIVLWNT
jgi:hypothetical protein